MSVSSSLWASKLGSLLEAELPVFLVLGVYGYLSVYVLSGDAVHAVHRRPGSHQRALACCSVVPWKLRTFGK